eukprot:tig00000691_g3155.t1
MPPKVLKVLVCGDVNGRLGQLYERVNAVNDSHGPFTALFCVGSFFGVCLSSKYADPKADVMDYIAGRKRAPIKTYVVQGNDSGNGELNRSLTGDMGPNLVFLGRSGVTSVQGLKVAFLSGTYDRARVTADTDNQPPDAPFDGYYTRKDVQMLVQLTELDSFKGVDLLLTAEWPKDFATNLPADGLPEGVDASWGSPVSSLLAAATKPRYHFASTHNRFFQRAPYRNRGGHHVTRMISLASIASEDPKNKYLHALQLTPLIEVDAATLTQVPPNSTRFPFAAYAPAGEVDDDVPPPAPAPAPAAPAAPAAPLPDQSAAFLNSSDNALPTSFGKKKPNRNEGRPPPPKRPKPEAPIPGLLAPTPRRSPDTAAAAAVAAAAVRCPAPGRAAPLKGGAGKRGRGEDGPTFVKDPRAWIASECWFCLGSSQVEKHLVISVGDEVYLALAKGALVSQHVLLLPISHYASYNEVPESVLAEMERYKEALKKFFASQNLVPVLFDRSVQTKGAAHFHLQVVPVPEKLAPKVQEVYEKEGGRHRIGFEKILPFEDLKKQLGPRDQYFLVELPTGDRLLHRVPGGARHPLQFGREALAVLINKPERGDWKACVVDEDEEKAMAGRFRDRFAPFEPQPAS